MANLPFISVITPSLDQGKFLEKTIQSVIGQGYPNLEYIIIDGGSRDCTLSILKKYDSRLTHWLSEPDDGQAEALSKGLALAKGSVIGWINADDFYLPMTLLTVGRFFQKNPSKVLLYGDCVFVDADGTPQRLFRPGNFDLRKLLLSDYIPQPSMFLRRDLIETVGPFSGDYKYALDYDYLLRAGLCFHQPLFSYQPRPFACFRLHPESQTINSRVAGYVDFWRVRHNFFRRSELKSEVLESKRSVYLQMFCEFMLLYSEEQYRNQLMQIMPIFIAARDEEVLHNLIQPGALLTESGYRKFQRVFQKWSHFYGLDYENEVGSIPVSLLHDMNSKLGHAAFTRGETASARKFAFSIFRYRPDALLKRNSLNLIAKISMGPMLFGKLKMIRGIIVKLQLLLLQMQARLTANHVD